MKRLFTFFCMMLAVMLQLTLAPKIAIGRARPDFVLVVIISFAMRRGVLSGAIIGVITGVTIDAMAGSPVGILTALYGVCAVLAGLFSLKVRDSRIIFPVLGALWITALKESFLMLYSYMQGLNISMASVWVIVYICLYNAVLTLGFYQVSHASADWTPAGFGGKKKRAAQKNAVGKRYVSGGSSGGAYD